MTVIIGRFLRRWLRLHGEAARLLGSQKSRRFCQIAKSPTLLTLPPSRLATAITSGYRHHVWLPPSRLAAANTSGCRQTLMSAPASVPRVARLSEATAFARSSYITDIIFFMLCAIATVMNSALVKILPPQQGDRPGKRGRLSAQEPMKGLLPAGYAGCLSGGLCSGLLSGASAGSPSGGRYRVTVRG